MAECCSDCGGPLGQDDGPPDGWELAGGRIVCDACCVLDLKANVARVIKLAHSKDGLSPN